MSAFLNACLDPIINTVREYFMKHVCYIVHVSDNVESLSREAGKLEAKRKDVEETIRGDEPSMKKPTHEVDGWLKRVEDLRPKVESITTKYNTRNCMFFNNTCSFNCFSNHSIGKRAAEELANVEEELNFITEKVKGFTTEIPPKNVQEMPVDTLPPTSRSELESKLKIALDFLRDDANGSLGVYGMGGVGKTTLLRHVNNKLAEDSSFGFDRVVFVTAARECTVDKLQKLIARGLSLPEVGNHYNDIFNYLKNKNFVILLDDLWERLDVEQIGIPLPFGVVSDMKLRRKLILASRSVEVCHRMEVSKTLRVECLSPEAARLLFREKVGGIEVIESHRLIPKLADEVADECGRLPQALIVIGRAMAGVRDYRVWENAITELRRSKTYAITGEEDDPLPLLKFSYDYLKDQQKQECLLHCALWPEDFEIPKNDLIKCWMGHGLLQDYDDIEEAYNKGHAIIDSLQKACLLEHVEARIDEAFIVEVINERVRLHDLIRDMALWIARDCGRNEKKWVVLAGTQLQDAPRDGRTWGQAHKISLMNNYIKELPSNIQSSPNLTTLMLQSNHLTPYGLKVAEYFRALKYLDLSYNQGLHGVPIEICGLDALEYLNLSFTDIRSLPEELKNLRNLKYLLLRRTGLRHLPNGLLPNLVNLLELDLCFTPFRASQFSDQLDCLQGGLKALGTKVDNHSDLQKLIQLSGIPVRRLSLVLSAEEYCSPLRLFSPNILGRKHMHSVLKELLLSIRTQCPCVVEIGQEGRLASLEELELVFPHEVKDIICKGVDPVIVFPKLRRLRMSFCNSFEHVSWTVNLPCLEILALGGCEKMEQIVSSGKMTELDGSRPAFPSLRTLFLHDLEVLSSISDEEIAFPSLEYLGVFGCPRFRGFPFTSFASCRNLKTIAGKDWWDGLIKDDNIEKLFRPLVRH